MNIKTSWFDEIKVDKNKTIHFPEGLVGFTDYRNFVIIHIEKYWPFLWLQSVDNGSLSFVMTDPFIFFPDYSPELSDDDVQFLGIDDPNAVVIYSLISFKKDIQQSTRFNLFAPLCINHKMNRAKQVILNNSKYGVAHKADQVPADTTQSEHPHQFHQTNHLFQTINGLMMKK